MSTGGDSATGDAPAFGDGSGPPPGAMMGPPPPDDAAIGIAWFKLVGGAIMLVVGTELLVMFFRSRWVLDIRTRGPALVVMGGTAILSQYLAGINVQCGVIWGENLDWFWPSLLIFFIQPMYKGSFMARAIRLFVVFHPKARKTCPWLIPERNYMVVLLIASLGFLTIPLYHEYTLDTEREVFAEQFDWLRWINLSFGVALAMLYPLIRDVDDMFNISTELSIVMACAVLLGVIPIITKYHASAEVHKWIGNNCPFVFNAIIFFVSVGVPLWKLAFDPLAAKKHDYAARVLLSRRDKKSGSGTSSSSSGSGTERSGSAASEEAKSTGRLDGAREEEEWTVERLASTPILAAAFEQFVEKALCHESVLFLAEVSKYMAGDYSSVAITPGAAEGGSSQYKAFVYITKTFIRDGSSEEVNISSADKKRIMDVYRRGLGAFQGLPTNEKRRCIFSQAYQEVLQMLEDNLLRRFLLTDVFKHAAKQRETVMVLGKSPEESPAPQEPKYA